jgi:hypothetical protein
MSKKRTIHGIDPTAPGGIEALLAHHRLTFGDAVMEAGAGDGGDPAPAGDPSPAADPAPKGDPAPEPKASEWDGKVESLPAEAQKIIADLRKGAGDERVAAKTLAAIQAALNPDAKAGDKPDAAALTKALSERDADAKQAKTELAVFRLAAKQGADADALLDSRAFLAKIAELDPSKTADIEKAIKDAVTANPKLKTVLAAGASGANFSGGSGESAKTPTTLAGAVANHYRT